MRAEEVPASDASFDAGLERPARRAIATATGYLLAVAIVTGLALVRWSDPGLDRPLQLDELLTLEVYSLAGVDPSGAPRALRRADELARLPAATPIQLIAGIHRSLGVWREPNNHAVHSLLVDAVLAPGHAGPRRIRLPAFAGAIAATVALGWVAGPVLGWHASVPFVTPLAFCTPYVLVYGATARGYTWTVALALALFGLLYRLRRAPSSVASNGVCLLVAFALVVNLVSAAVGWIVPLYGALLLQPPRPRLDAAGERAWRRALLVQLVLLGAAVGLFLLPHLPSLYASLRQYGVARDDPGGFFREFRHLFAPSIPWAAALGVGTVLAVVLPWRGRQGTVAAVALAALVVTALHLLVASRLPYARVLVQLLPVAWLGVAAGAEATVGRLAERARPVVLASGSTILAVALAVSARTYRGIEDGRLAAVHAMPRVPPLAPTVRVVLPPIVDYHWAKYLPASWLAPADRLAEQAPVDLRVWVTRQAGEWGLRLDGAGGPAWHRYVCPPAGCSVLDGDTGMAVARGRIVPLAGEPAAATWVAWVLDPQRIGLDGSAVIEHVRSYGVPYLRRSGFVRIKTDVIGSLRALEFFPTAPDERRRVREAVTAGRARFGGDAFQFVPEAGFSRR